MAYQPKSYKKFVATAATATLVASAVAPMASAAFSDVADRYEDAVNYLTTEGIAQGYPGDKFGTNDSIKRQDAAVMIANALGANKDGDYANAGFTDVPADRQWAVNFLVEQKIVDGKAAGQFGANDFTTREEMSKIIANAYKLVGDDTNAFPFTDVSDTFKQFVDALYENGITEGKDADSFGTGLVTRGEFALFIYRAEGSPVATPATPEVVSVSATNLKQVEVTYNSTELTEEDVEDADFYTFLDANEDEVAIDNISLDGDKVVVTFANPVSNQAKLDLTVDKDAFGGAEDYTATIEFFDVTIPEVDSAAAVGSRTVKVTFSEPINTTGLTASALRSAFELNDGSQFVKNVTFMNNNTVANVEFYTDLEEGTQSISISDDLEDYAGYNVVATTLDFEVVLDTDAPTIVEVKDVTPTKATLVFSEDLVDSLTASDFYHTNTGEVASSATLVNGNEVELTFATGNELPNGTAYIYVAKEAIVDLWGNENDQLLRVAALVVADETAPTVQKVEASAQNQIEVTFSEEVDEDTATLTLLDADGEELDIIDTVAYKIDANGTHKDVLVVTLDENIYGDHKLVVEDVEDLVGNALDSEEKTFFVEDETKPLFSDFSSTLYQDDQATEVLVVDFDEAMAVTGQYSVLDLSKYIVNGTSLADVDTAKITAIDGNTKVQIEVKTSDLNIATGAAQLEIGRVADAAGNTTTSLAGAVDIDAAGSVAAKSVNATAHNKIVVTLDDLVTDFEADDFTLLAGVTNIDAAVIGASINNSGTTSVITFTLNNNTINAAGKYAADGSTITVNTTGVIDTVNAYGEPVSVSAPAVDKISGKVEKNAADKFDVEASFTDADADGLVDELETATFVVNYNEAIKASTLSSLSYEVDGFTVSSVAVDAGDASKVLITATANADDTDYMTEVSHVVNITDVNNNVIAAGNSYEVYGLVAPVVVVNGAPTATAVSITGTETVGSVLTGNYTYADAESDAEGTSTFQWYSSDDAVGTNKVAITGATATTYTLVAGDTGNFITFEVTPVASAGTATGTPSESAPTGAIQ
ncbi:MAG: S-layer homology domain-containing protein [Paenisporosarcina sp.]|nr:S-layer homology domain-containing protein [Paenisporosarcina sp.]